MIAQVNIAAHHFEVFFADIAIGLEQDLIAFPHFADQGEAAGIEFKQLAPRRQVAGDHLFHDRDLGGEPTAGNRLNHGILVFKVAIEVGRGHAGQGGQFGHGQGRIAAFLDQGSGNVEQLLPSGLNIGLRPRHGAILPRVVTRIIERMRQSFKKLS